MQYFVVSLVVLATVAVALGQEPDHKQMKANMDACLQSTGAQRSDAEEVRKLTIPSTSQGACLYACLDKKVGVMTSDNKFDANKAKEMIAPMKEKNATLYTQISSIYDQCKGSESSATDECKAALNIVTCISNAVKKAGITLERPPPPPQ